MLRVPGMLGNNRGGSKLVSLVLLAVVGGAIYIAFRLIPVYMASTEFKDSMLALCKAAQLMDDAEVQKQLLQRAKELDLPIGEQNIVIRRDPRLTLEAHWWTTLNFPGGYSRTFEFHPIADESGVRETASGLDFP